MLLSPNCLLAENPRWAELLTAYLDAVETVGDDWCPRIEKRDDWRPEELAQVHGKLIAHELLEFDLSDRLVGIRYRPTSTAKLVMAQPVAQ